MCFSDISGQATVWNIKLLSYYLHNCTYLECLLQAKNKQTKTTKQANKARINKQTNKQKSPPSPAPRPPQKNRKQQNKTKLTVDSPVLPSLKEARTQKSFCSPDSWITYQSFYPALNCFLLSQKLLCIFISFFFSIHVHLLFHLR